MTLKSFYNTLDAPYVRVSDTKSSGTAGTSYAAGAYRTVTINTEEQDADGICSLSSNQFTLAAGSYAVFVVGQRFYASVNFCVRIQTAGGTTLLKWPAFRASIDGGSRPFGDGPNCSGRFTIAASTPAELQIDTSASVQQVALSDGENEVYWTVELVKLT